MKTTGLLWFDDDPRRPVVAKIAEAVERFRERVGFEPTICEVNPAQLATATAPEPKKRQRRTRVAKQPEIVLPKKLHLVPSEQMYPNYFMLGTEGEEMLVPLWRRADSDYDGPVPSRRKPRVARAATQKQVQAAPAPKVKVAAEARPVPTANVEANKPTRSRAKPKAVASVVAPPKAKEPQQVTPGSKGKTRTVVAKDEPATLTMTPKGRNAGASKSPSMVDVAPAHKTRAKAKVHPQAAAQVTGVKKATSTPKTKVATKISSVPTTKAPPKASSAPKSKAVAKAPAQSVGQTSVKKSAAPKVRAVAKEAAVTRVTGRAKKTPALDVAIAASKAPAPKRQVAVQQDTATASKGASKRPTKSNAKATAKETVTTKPKTTAKSRPAPKASASAKPTPASKARVVKAETPISKVKPMRKADKPVAAAAKPEALPVAKSTTQRVKRSA